MTVYEMTILKTAVIAIGVKPLMLFKCETCGLLINTFDLVDHTLKHNSNHIQIEPTWIPDDTTQTPNGATQNIPPLY